MQCRCLCCRLLIRREGCNESFPKAGGKAGQGREREGSFVFSYLLEKVVQTAAATWWLLLLHLLVLELLKWWQEEEEADGEVQICEESVGLLYCERHT